MNDPVSYGNRKGSHLLPLNVRSQATPGLARGPKPAAHRALPTTTPLCGQKAHAFSTRRAFFPSDPRSCPRPKKLAAHCALPTTTPFCGQKAHAFSTQRAFVPSGPRSCTRPKARRSLCAAKLSSTPKTPAPLSPLPQQQEENTSQKEQGHTKKTIIQSPYVLLNLPSPLLAKATGDRTHGAVFSSIS